MAGFQYIWPDFRICPFLPSESTETTTNTAAIEQGTSGIQLHKSAWPNSTGQSLSSSCPNKTM